MPHDGMSKKYALTEHTEYKWVFIEEVPSFTFVDSDMKIFPDIKKAVLELQGE